jgi:hypothetical protein
MKKEKIEVVGSLLKKECIYIYFFKIWFKLSKI